MPAYNEELRLAKSLPVILEYLNKQTYSWELIVVDDGSRDDTSGVARSVGGDRVRVLRNSPNAGKGASIKRGMMEAKGAWRLFTDADLSTPIEALDTFWKFTENGADVVIGSRALTESKLEVRQPRSRELLGRVFNAFVQTFLVQGIFDTQCGFKLFSSRAADAIFPEQELAGFAFDVEILILARKHGFAITEAPVPWRNDPGSKVSMMAGARGFYDLLNLRLQKKKK